MYISFIHNPKTFDYEEYIRDATPEQIDILYQRATAKGEDFKVVTMHIDTLHSLYLRGKGI